MSYQKDEIDDIINVKINAKDAILIRAFIGAYKTKHPGAISEDGVLNQAVNRFESEILKMGKDKYQEMEMLISADFLTKNLL